MKLTCEERLNQAKSLNVKGTLIFLVAVVLLLVSCWAAQVLPAVISEAITFLLVMTCGIGALLAVIGYGFQLLAEAELAITQQ